MVTIEHGSVRQQVKTLLQKEQQEKKELELKEQKEEKERRNGREHINGSVMKKA